MSQCGSKGWAVCVCSGFCFLQSTTGHPHLTLVQFFALICLLLSCNPTQSAPHHVYNTMASDSTGVPSHANIPVSRPTTTADLVRRLLNPATSTKERLALQALANKLVDTLRTRTTAKHTSTRPLHLPQFLTRMASKRSSGHLSMLSPSARRMAAFSNHSSVTHSFV